MTSLSELTAKHIQQNEEFGTANYHPLPVVLSKGKAEWVWDVDGKKYLDMLSAYSAVNQGHSHPKIIEALSNQAQKITLTSRAFHNDQLGPWCEELSVLCGMDKAIPMNTGAEAVETAIKLARKWGYLVKKVPDDQAEILVCHDNFSGRTISIISFSTEEKYRKNFGPFTPGFKAVPFGDVAALEKAIGPNTVAFLVEPIQGEAGVIVPPLGYLKRAEELCRQHNVLFIADEIQTGLARTGKLFAYEYESLKPDLLVLGKALGGGILPISAVVGKNEVMGLLRPGDHGSTFGGNPLACAVSRAALAVIRDEGLVHRSFELGERFRNALANAKLKNVEEIRGRGLLNAIEVSRNYGHARKAAEALMHKGLLAKETREQTLRFAPPLVIEKENLDWAIEVICEVIG